MKEHTPIIYGNEIAYQREQRYLANLRRKGRGRKHGFVLSPYLKNHTRIFGETDIFKNIRDEAKPKNNSCAK